MDSATRISYIKAHRSEFGSDLKTAKMAVDNGWFPGRHQPDQVKMELALRTVRVILEDGPQLTSVKEALEHISWGLSEVEFGETQ